MTWIRAIGILPLALLLAIPLLLVLLYFLKLRRKPIEVPSTYLWMRTVEDLHVNSIWQRLRTNWLLLLQLLAVALLILSCLRPGCQGESLTGERFVFMVDQSASMAATDVNDSRLEEAKRQCELLIDRMKPDDVAMLIGFSDRASVFQSYTKNKSLLRRKLSRIRQTNRGTDLRQAFQLASGLSNVGQTSDRESEVDIQVAESLPATVYVLSDGGVSRLTDFSLGNLQPEFRPVGGLEPPHNVGITLFRLNRGLDANASIQALVRLENCHDEDHVVDVTLHVDGDVFDAQRAVEIEKESSTGLSFDLNSLREQFDRPVEIRLEIEDEDDYGIDNVAYAVWSPPQRPKLLLVTPFNEYLVNGLTTGRIARMCDVEIQAPAYMQSDSYQERAESGFYDLILFDQVAPDEMPQSSTVFFGSAPPSDAWTLGERQFPAPIILTSKTHPISENLAISDVQLLEASSVEGPQGSVSLIESTFGSIMSIGPRQGFEDMVIGFSIVKYMGPGKAELVTDWFKHPSFPVFVHNLIVYMGRVRRGSRLENVRPGDLVKLRSDRRADEIEIRKPTGGPPTTIRQGADQQYLFGETDEVGVYTVSESPEKNVDQMFSVNLFDSRESDIRVRDKLEIGFEEVEGDTKLHPARREYWPFLVIAAIGILVLEWIVFNRRVRI